MTIDETTGTCGKCGGAGRILAFSHIQGGTCFWCNGTGRLTVRQQGIQTGTPDPRRCETVRILGHDYQAVRNDKAERWEIYAEGMAYVFDDGRVVFTLGITEAHSLDVQMKIRVACRAAIRDLTVN